MEGDNHPPVCPYRFQQVDERPQAHPLIAFKHFIDDQFSMITRLPLLSEVTRKMQEARVAKQQDEELAHYLWTGSKRTPDHHELIVRRICQANKSHAVDATLMLLRMSDVRNKHVDPAKVEALYQDNELLALEQDRFGTPLLSFGGACYYMPETGDNLPSTASLFGRWPSPAPSFLSVEWFKNSIYSPTNVEADAAFGELHAGKVRSAFEDLLNTTLSKSWIKSPDIDWFTTRPPFESNSVQSVSFGPGLDWMLSLYCRGVLPPRPGLLSAGLRWDYKRDWYSLASCWAPRTTDKEFAELVREMASPAAPPYTNPLLKTLQDQDWSLRALELKMANASRTQDDNTRQIGEEEEEEDDDNEDPYHWLDFLDSTRSKLHEFASKESHMLWRAIYHENPDEAADIIVRWEGNHGDVKDLIDDEAVVRDYLQMNTNPCLWPLCEALEKAHSELLMAQHLIQEYSIADSDALGASAPSAEERKAVSQQKPVEGATKQPIQTQSIAQRTPGVLAALTTTQTTRLPDGTVTTKTVLKKRFADGREETTESLNVEYGEQQAESQQPVQKKGWFWS